MTALAAIALLLFAPGAAPDNAAAFVKLSREAEQARHANRGEEAIALYRRALVMRPGWKEGWWALGSLYYQRDLYPQCRDAFRRLTGLEKQGGPAWSMLGLCEFETRDFGLAAADLRRGQEFGVSVPSIDEVAKYHLALLYTSYEAYEEALELLVGLAQRGKDDAGMIAATGIAALRKPLLPEALPPQDREVVYLAGKAFWDAGARRAAEAQRDFQSLLAKYPSYPGVHYIYASFLLQTDPEKAVDEFRKELAVSPRHVPARIALAMEFQRRGDAAAGLPYAKEAAGLLPDSFAAHAALGRLLADTGELDAGAKELELAEKLDPESPQPRIALASVYAKLGRAEDAARERREFLRLKDLQKPGGER